MTEAKYPLLCICGSMRFHAMMHRVAERMTLEGHIVLMPHVTKLALERDNAPFVNRMLDSMHMEKIRIADKVFIVDCTIDNQGNLMNTPYVGESTLREIAYSLFINKHLEYLSKHIQAGLGPLFL